MRFFVAIDELMISLCTKISHSFQQLTGQTNFFIAKFGVLMATFNVITQIANYFHQILQRKTTLFDLLLCMWLNFILFRDAKTLDEANKNWATEERAIFPNLTSSMLYRLLWIGFSIHNTIALTYLPQSQFKILEAIHMVSFSYGLVIFYYFCAVEPLRPGKSKIRQWIEEISFGTLKPVKVETNS